MKIGGIQKTTLKDYPEKVAAIIFTQGCNFNCGFCHNPELVQPTLSIFDLSEEKVLEFLKKRKKVLDGVTITGGEPTLYPDLPDFIKKLKKDLGYDVKLDTNGTNPKIVENLINQGLVDYLAMDLKTILDNYEVVVGVAVNRNDILASINLIMKSGKPYEFRTTLVKGLHDASEPEKIASGLISGAERYYLQKFSNRTKLLDPSFHFKEAFTEKEMEEMAQKCRNFVKICEIR